MSLRSEIWTDLEALVKKGDLAASIRLLEEALPSAESPEEVAAITRRLCHYYQSAGRSQDFSKALKLGLLAGQAYVAMGRMAPAVAMMNQLQRIPDGRETSVKLQRHISQSFGRVQQKRKSSDENHPPPTPYQELKGFVSFDQDDDLVNRLQWIPPSPQKAPLFSWLKPAEVFELIHIAHLRDLPPGGVLFREGDRSTAFYVVAEGEMRMSNRFGIERAFKEGDYFGELALFAKVPRTATLKSTTGARLLEFSEQALHQAFEISPGLEQKILHFYELRLFINLALRHFLFHGMSAEELESLWEELNSVRVPQGRVLYPNERGSNRDRFYLLTKGRVEGHRKGADPVVWKAGDWVGPPSALDEVIVAEDSLLLECHRLVLEIHQDKLKNCMKAFDADDPYDFFIDQKTKESILD